MLISLNIYFDGLVSDCAFFIMRCFNEYSFSLNFFTWTVNVKKKEWLLSSLSSLLLFRITNASQILGLLRFP